MKKYIKILIFVILLQIMAAASTAILLPLLSKLHMLEIISPIPQEIKKGQKYVLCLYQPDRDGKHLFPNPTVAIFVSENPTDWNQDKSPSQTFGQEVGSGVQVVAIDLGTFSSDTDGALRVEISPLPKDVKIGVFTGRWKIATGILGILFVSLLATITLGRLICRKIKI